MAQNIKICETEACHAPDSLHSKYLVISQDAVHSEDLKFR